MPHNEDLTWADVVRKIEAPCRILLREIPAAEEVRLDLIAAQNGATDLAWGRTLFECFDTKNVTLTINETANTVACQAGANLFANARVGRDVQLTGWVDADNNQTTEITAKIDSDTIEIANHTGTLVNATEDARAQENPMQFELDKIDDLQATMVGIGNIDTTFNTNAELLRDFS